MRHVYHLYYLPYLHLSFSFLPSLPFFLPSLPFPSFPPSHHFLSLERKEKSKSWYTT